MPSFVYQAGLHAISGAAIVDWVNDPIYLALLTSAHVPGQIAHNNFTDVVADEIPAGGTYVSGGIALPGRSAVRDDATLQDRLLATVAEWPLSTIQADYAVIYVNSVPPDDLLLFLFDFGGTRMSSLTDFPVSWQSDIVHRFKPPV